MKKFRRSCNKCIYLQRYWTGCGPIIEKLFCKKYNEEFELGKIDLQVDKTYNEKYDCFQDKYTSDIEVKSETKIIPKIKPKIVSKFTNNKIKFLRDIATLINQNADKEVKEIYKIKFLRDIATLINQYADEEEKEINCKFF